MLEGHYSARLVILSVFIAIFASYNALTFAGRLISDKSAIRSFRFAGGALTMGFGIWCMHFIGMMAFSLPIVLGYNMVTTLLSLAFAVASSALALAIVCQTELPWQRLLGGAVLMGCGVAGMHYIGMASLEMSPPIQYHAGLYFLSFLLAMAASAAAMWIAFRSGQDAFTFKWHIAASVAMGIAIAGMHYVGMAAAQFPIGSICGGSATMDTGWLSTQIIVNSIGGLLISFIFSIL